MPVVGLKVLHLSSSSLGLLFTSMGAGSIVGAMFIIPWASSPLVARQSHALSEFAACLGLLVNGVGSPDGGSSL